MLLCCSAAIELGGARQSIRSISFARTGAFAVEAPVWEYAFMNLRFRRSITEFAALAVVATASFGATSATAQAQPQSTDHMKTPRSISIYMTDLVIGLISDRRLHPNVNAVDTYAGAFHWHKTPPETNALLNAKVGYATKVAGQLLLLGGDGSNDIFAVSARDGFRVDEAVTELRRVYRLKKQDSEDSDGGRVDSYILVDGRTEVGVLSLTYGIAEPIRGAGTIDFVAMDRARKETA